MLYDTQFEVYKEDVHGNKCHLERQITLFHSFLKVVSKKLMRKKHQKAVYWEHELFSFSKFKVLVNL